MGDAFDVLRSVDELFVRGLLERACKPPSSSPNIQNFSSQNLEIIDFEASVMTKGQQGYGFCHSSGTISD
jgi:hypothetical protein